MPSRQATAEVDIDAPIGVVWQVMTDLPAYGEWNPFILAITGRLEAGAALQLRVRWMDGSEVASAERVIEASAPRDGGARLVYDFDSWMHTVRMIRASRLQRLDELAAGRTRYHTTEVFTGWGVAGVPLEKVQDGFERHASALKTRAESLAR